MELIIIEMEETNELFQNQTIYINQQVLDLILNKDMGYSTIKYIRELLCNIYNASEYPNNLFRCIANADEEHKELVFNILESLKDRNTMFIIEKEIVPSILNIFNMSYMKKDYLEENSDDYQ